MEEPIINLSRHKEADSDRKSISIIIKMFLICFSIVLIIFNNSLKFSKYLAFLLIIVSIVNVVLHRKSWELFIIFGFIAYANYSIAIADYLFPLDNYLTSLRYDPSSIEAINILFFFNVLLLIFVPTKIVKNKESFFEKGSHNIIIVYGIIMLLIIIFFIGFTKPENIGERGSPSTFYEYSTILFIIGFYYSHNKTEKTILSIVMFCYMFQNLIYGGRVTAIQLAIIWFLVFLKEKISILKALPFIIIALIVLTAIGQFRANITLSISSLEATINGLLNSKLVNDTSYSAFFTSQTFILTKNLLSVGERLDLFGRFLLSMFLGGSAVPDSNLANFTFDYYTHCYGGVLPFFGDFYLGWIGVIILAIYICFLSKKLYLIDKKDKNDGLKKCIGIYFVSTCPRWYLYSPSPIFRGIMILLVIYFVFKFFNKMTTHKKYYLGD